MKSLFLEALQQREDGRTLDLCLQLDEVGAELENINVPINDDELLESLVRLEGSLKRLVAIFETFHLQ